LSRRRELTALRLIGTPTQLLRWAQWCEAALPTALGSVFAILTGTYAGATYLQLDNDRLMPLSSGLALAAIAVVLSAALAAITVIGTGAPLDPDHIRAE
jgi:predicted lysophospholipase L1 biosynthesis ABC-type transport system permease subunit